MNLHRYWIRFELSGPLGGPRPGCGVTALSYEDALAILGDTVFRNKEMPPVKDVIADVDISSLDQKHVIPNMEAPVWRGVWYPKGYLEAH